MQKKVKREIGDDFILQRGLRLGGGSRGGRIRDSSGVGGAWSRAPVRAGATTIHGTWAFLPVHELFSVASSKRAEKRKLKPAKKKLADFINCIEIQNWVLKECEVHGLSGPGVMRNILLFEPSLVFAPVLSFTTS